MSAGLFVTGTDTDCGKTVVAAALIRMLRDRGLRVAGFKPVAAGAERRDGKLCNDDALTLLEVSVPGLEYADVNPYCFAPPIAPHIAAAAEGREICIEPILAARDRLAAKADIVIAEGAGGWLVPLGEDFDIAGLARALGLPVLMVVGLRLGCINHACLTERAIVASGAQLVGWIGTQVDRDFACMDQNVQALRARLRAPCLGLVPHAPGRAAEATVGQLALGEIVAALGLPAAIGERHFNNLD